MFSKMAVLVAAVSCAAVVQAQNGPSIPPISILTLEDVLQAASQSAPVMDVARAEVDTAVAARRVAALRANPHLTVEAENFAGGGSYRGADSLETSTSLELPLELGGKRSARIGVAEAQILRAGLGAAQIEADLRFAVIQNYVQAVAAQQRLTIAKAANQLAIEAVRAADVRVKAGKASPIEVQRARVAQFQAEADLQQAARLHDVTRAALEKRIGRPVQGELDQSWFVNVRPVAGHDANGNLALAAADADVRVADADLRLARSQRVPDLTVGAGARHLNETGDVAALFSVSVPLQLFNNGKAGLAQASAAQRRAEAQKRVTALEVEQAIAVAKAQAENAALRAKMASGPALQAAEESARIARIGYREGKFGQLDLLDAERTLAHTQLDAVEALEIYHTSVAQLERLTARAPSHQDK